MSWMTVLLREARRIASQSTILLLTVLSSTSVFFTAGCMSHAQNALAPIAPPKEEASAAPASHYATVAVDSPDREWELLTLLRTGGVRVDKTIDGDERVYDSPACRAILVRFRRVIRARLDVVAQNMANTNTTRDAKGLPNPYRRQFIMSHPDGSFGIEEDPSPFLKRYIPGHPEADASGYVRFPNIDPAVEEVNAIQASKAYRATDRILSEFDPTYVDSTVNNAPQAFRSTALQDAVQQIAVERTLAGVIAKFPYVTDAVVRIDAQRDKTGDDLLASSATIVISTTGTGGQERSLVDPAVDTVAGAVAGMRRESVNVVVNGVSYHPAASSGR